MTGVRIRWRPGDVMWRADAEYRTGKDGLNRMYCAGLEAGDADWMTGQDGKIAGLRFSCPCGCKYLGSVVVYEGGWNWNQDVDVPTLTPSIQLLSDCRWHGYLTAGVFVPC